MVRILLASLTLIDARITTLQGTSLEGTLTAVDAQTVVIDDSGEDVSVAREDVLEIRFPDQTDGHTEPSPQQILLVDGSTISVTQTTCTSEQLTSSSSLFGDVAISRTTVRAIRLQEISDDWGAQWNSFLKRTNDRDLLVVFKRDGTGLDFLSGTIAGVTDNNVPFLLEGDEIPVPRTRVFGVVFAAAAAAPPARTGPIALELRSNDTVRLQRVEFKDATITGTTSWGQEIRVSAERVRGIDFSAGRVHYLSDLEPISEQYFGLDPPGQEWGDLFADDLATRTGLSKQWKMSRDRFANNGQPPLTLRGKSYRKGLCIFPKAQVEYALDGQYTKLVADVGVDDEVAFNQRDGQPPTAVALQIKGDGRLLMEKLVSAPEDTFPLELDVGGISTLTLSVDFGDGSSTCDYLDLADAKLIVNAAR